jgi:LysM repeat protein
MTRGSSLLRAVLLVSLLALPQLAFARVVMYIAHAGDTPESVAADYYGNRSLAQILAEDNGVPANGKFQVGQKVRVPTAFRYHIRRGDTLDALAGRFLDDRRRSLFLAQLNGIRPTDKLHEGQELTVPFVHVHRVDAPESISSVARSFYGDASKSKLLAEFNFRSAPMLAKGDRVLVPIAHARIRSVLLVAPAKPPTPHAPPPSGGAPPPVRETDRREEELAERVQARLVAAEHAYLSGSYSDVPAELDRLLAAEDPTEAQLAEIFRLKAFAYVALGLDDLAVTAFREVIARKPDLKLDEATTSPKIRAALVRARHTP